MYTVRKEYEFEYAHQLVGAYTKECNETIHGHSGRVELFFEAEHLDDSGMVIDFGKISDRVKPWIMRWLDHALFIKDDVDKEYLDILMTHNEKITTVDENPTAEYFAKLVYDNVVDLIDDSVIYRLSKVRFHESRTGYAEYQES
jgi:6-pyruvoyltetrahydropterin/6-carboxytetrahydropterin synthase